MRVRLMYNGHLIPKPQGDFVSPELIYKGLGDSKMLENETQCEDPHLVETFGEIPQHEPGAKLDSGKPRMGLVLQGFRKALSEISKVGTAGAEKYSDNGWMSVPNGEARYEDALLRHLLADEEIDQDFGLSHRAHMAWNALALLELELRNK